MQKWIKFLQQISNQYFINAKLLTFGGGFRTGKISHWGTGAMDNGKLRYVSVLLPLTLRYLAIFIVQKLQSLWFFVARIAWNCQWH